MPLLILLFIIVPIAEISLLVNVSGSIGAFNTILFVIVTAILGAYLVRQQGFATLRAVQQEMNQGRIPAMQLGEGIALLFAGAVLLTPGFITDAIGFALLTPPIRRAVVAWVAKQGFVQTHASQGSGASASPEFSANRTPNDLNVIEGEYRERD